MAIASLGAINQGRTLKAGERRNVTQNELALR
jgi:hypothetical protein